MQLSITFLNPTNSDGRKITSTIQLLDSAYSKGYNPVKMMGTSITLVLTEVTAQEIFTIGFTLGKSYGRDEFKTEVKE